MQLNQPLTKTEELYWSMATSCIFDRFGAKGRVSARRSFSLGLKEIVPVCRVGESKIKYFVVEPTLFESPLRVRRIRASIKGVKVVRFESVGQPAEEVRLLAEYREHGLAGPLLGVFRGLMASTAGHFRRYGFSNSDADRLALEVFEKALDGIYWDARYKIGVTLKRFMWQRACKVIRDGERSGKIRDWRWENDGLPEWSEIPTPPYPHILAGMGNSAKSFCELILAGLSAAESAGELGLSPGERLQAEIQVSRHLGLSIDGYEAKDSDRN